MLKQVFFSTDEKNLQSSKRGQTFEKTEERVKDKKSRGWKGEHTSWEQGQKVPDDIQSLKGM